MNYKLVPANRSHLPHIVAIEANSFDQPWSEDMLGEELYNDNVSILVAQAEDDTVLGFAMVRAVLDEGCLEKIAVAPQFRHYGIGSVLLSAFLRFAQAHLAFLTLEVRADNVPAIALYRKSGFVEVGRRKDYYTNPTADALLMTIEFQENGTGG